MVSDVLGACFASNSPSTRLPFGQIKSRLVVASRLVGSRATTYVDGCYYSVRHVTVLVAFVSGQWSQGGGRHLRLLNESQPPSDVTKASRPPHDLRDARLIQPNIASYRHARTTRLGRSRRSHSEVGANTLGWADHTNPLTPEHSKEPLGSRSPSPEKIPLPGQGMRSPRDPSMRMTGGQDHDTRVSEARPGLARPRVVTHTPQSLSELTGFA